MEHGGPYRTSQAAQNIIRSIHQGRLRNPHGHQPAPPEMAPGVIPILQIKGFGLIRAGTPDVNRQQYCSAAVVLEIKDYIFRNGIQTIWPAEERILVCVGANIRSTRLIHAARRMAAGLRAEWIAVHVEVPSQARPTKSDLKQLAKSYAAR